MSLTWNEYGWDNVIFAANLEYATRDIFLTGESYVGHYVPVFAAHIHNGNKAKEGILINLKGYAIVNGFTDFRIQNSLDMGIVEQPDYDSINKVSVPACELAIKLCGTDGKITCTTSYFVCNTIFIPIISHVGHINYYNIRKKCGGILCYDFSNKEKLWLGDKEDHYYVPSRFLLSRMLTVTKIPNHVAIKIALELKKLLIDNNLLDVSQSDLEASMFKLMGRRGYGKECINCYKMMTRFYHQRVSLVILVCGTACVVKSTIATQLAQRLNLPNVLQTNMVYEFLHTRMHHWLQLLYGPKTAIHQKS